MFTGIVQEIGVVVATSHSSELNLVIKAERLTSLLHVGDSVAVNGVCLTAVAVESDRFCVQVIPETLKKTTLAQLREGSKVNLEPSLRVGDAFGGHILQGHIDAIGIVHEIAREGERLCWIEYPSEWQGYLIPQGAVAVDGVSLTIAALDDTNHRFKVAIIPYTYRNTIFQCYNPGTAVNLEFDILGKYVHRWMSIYQTR